MFHHFLLGQRQILATTDMGIEKVAIEQAEQVIDRHVKRDISGDGQWCLSVPIPVVMQYLAGDFTGGLPPREYPPHQEGIYNNLLFFHIVMEMMAMENEVGYPLVEEEKPSDKPAPLNSMQRLRRGYCFPFFEAFFQPEQSTISCTLCNLVLDRDVVMARIEAGQLVCPSCKGTSASGRKPPKEKASDGEPK